MSDIYCGIKKMRKGSRRGSMRECAEKGEVRYYGVKKIDSKILEIAKAPSKARNELNTVEKVRMKIIQTKGKMRKVINDMELKKNKEDSKKMKELKKDMDELKKEEEKYKKMLQDLKKKKSRK